jgi:ribosomal-protein-alanine N-acetyltransferase
LSEHLSVNTIVLTTARLVLVAATADMAKADVDNPVGFSESLGIVVPEDWPPAEFADAQGIFARSLERNPALAGWLHWYWILREGRILIGSGGFGGRPDVNGRIEIGFSIVDSYHGLGLATEAVSALIEWASEQPNIRKLIAMTATDNRASRRVLQKCGFHEVGSSDESDTVEYELPMSSKF